MESKMPNTYVLLSSNVLATAAASVTFSAIPSTYTDLVVRWTGRGTTSANYVITFNGTGGTSYSHIRLTGSGSAAASGQASNTSFIQYVGSLEDTSYTANIFDSNEIYVPGYATSNDKPTGGTGTQENNAASSFMNATAGLFRSSSAISSMTIGAQSGDMIAGSSFYLYGIKNS
jgi:hypothetical protein